MDGFLVKVLLCCIESITFGVMQEITCTCALDRTKALWSLKRLDGVRLAESLAFAPGVSCFILLQTPVAAASAFVSGRVISRSTTSSEPSDFFGVSCFAF